jgi:dipeptidyl aminopeptidase/acylaminoacyl peptidase
MLWVQPLDGLVAQPLAGTEDAFAPFWSPDSRFVGFFASSNPVGAVNGRLKKIDAAGGPPLTLCDFPAGAVGATWNRDDVILFTTTGPTHDGAIRRVSGAGGQSSIVMAPDTKNGEAEYWWPFFLPDGRHFLYLALGPGSQGGSRLGPLGIYVGSLESEERKLLVRGGSNAKYAQGYLMFLRETTLMAQPLDVRRLEVSGDAVPIAEQVQIGGAAGVTGAFTVSDDGVLAYQTGSGDVRSQLVWFDRSGKQIDVLGDPADYADVELSPDGRRGAVSVPDPAARTRDIWMFDVARGLRTRFTFDPTDDWSVVWSPDGSRVVFNSRRKGALDFYQKTSSGAGADEELLVDSNEKYPLAWSRDGRYILYGVRGSGGFDLWVLPLSGDRKPVPFVQTPFNEIPALFSPDGRWIAYGSNESGRTEVYVAPFPDAGGKWQVSTAGGTLPRWRGDGREIFYMDPDNTLMAAEVNGQDSAFEVGAVRELFETRPRAMRSSYDVTADGQRFLINTLEEPASATALPITLVVNWPALVKN